MPGRALALAARQLGTPSISIQHGSQVDQRVWSHFCHDWKFVWGDAIRGHLIRSGVAAESILVTGATIYEDLHQAAAKHPVRPLGPGTRVAFLASRTGGMLVSHAAAERSLEGICQACARAGLALTVKPHPADHTGLPATVVARFPGVRIAERCSAEDVILASDVVVVVSSTAAYEACVANRPLVVFLPPGVGDVLDVAAFGAALPVTSAEELGRAFASLAEPAIVARLAAGRRRLLGELLGLDGGVPSRRAARAILEIAGRASNDVGAGGRPKETR
jgi:hypothetical protein